LLKKALAEISIIEFAVYAFVAYSGMLMLIISVIKEVPTTKALSIVRAIYLFPSVFAAGILAQISPTISLPSVTNTILAVNTTEVFEETIDASIVIQSDVWISFHVLLMLVMMIYIITQLLILLTRKE